MMLIRMTAHAGARRILELERAVTVLAERHGVTAEKRERRLIVIELYVAAPAGFVVAALATCTKLPGVRVCAAMTPHAGGGKLDAVKRSAVTGVALDLCVAAVQRKFRGGQVIEVNCAPFCRVVTCFAFWTVAAQMGVLQTMTSHAGRIDILVYLACMAGRACDVGVRSNKQERGLTMVKRPNVTPRVLGVAAVAAGPETPKMRVALMVAVVASGRSFAIFPPAVAAVAAHRLVRPLELEIRECVIEGLSIKLHNIGSATLVIRMAAHAFSIGRAGKAAMVALP